MIYSLNELHERKSRNALGGGLLYYDAGNLILEVQITAYDQSISARFGSKEVLTIRAVQSDYERFNAYPDMSYVVQLPCKNLYFENPSKMDLSGEARHWRSR